MKERYVFVFEYENDWMIVLYENGVNVEYFNNAEDDWDNSLNCMDLFLENGGNRYWYNLPSYDCIEDLDIFELGDHPIRNLEEYLLKTDSLDEPGISESFMEIERKWLLKKFPREFPLITDAVCEQSYLGQDPEIRIRKRVETGKQPVYFIDIKSDGDLSRREVEISIPEMKYKAVKNILDKPVINKRWFVFDLGYHKLMEVTIVDPGSATEFIYAEVEFTTEEEAKNFTFPIEDAIEVTDNPEYKMKNYWKRTRIEKVSF